MRYTINYKDHPSKNDPETPNVPIVKIKDTLLNVEYCEATQSHYQIEITLECCRNDVRPQPSPGAHASNDANRDSVTLLPKKKKWPNSYRC